MLFNKHPVLRGFIEPVIEKKSFFQFAKSYLLKWEKEKQKVHGGITWPI